MDFTCIVNRGVPLNEEIRSFLLYSGWEMARDGKMKKHIKNGNDLSGIIFTNFHTAVIGMYAGIIFEAEIESEAGDVSVRYMISRSDLDRKKSELGLEKIKWEKGSGLLSWIFWELMGKALSVPSREAYS